VRAYLSIAMFIVLGLDRIAAKSGSNTPFWRRLLPFVLLWVPLAVVFGLAHNRFMGSLMEYLRNGRK